MATLYTHQSSNITKTWLLVGVFLAIVVGIGYFFSVYYGNPSILTFAIIFAVGMNIVSYWNSDKIAIAMAKAVPASTTQYVELHQIVENLAITAGLPKPKVYIIPDAAPNAFATGRNAKHASIAVTQGLLQSLTRTELEGVLAHELAHIGNRDILLQSMVAILVGFIAIVADMFTRSLLWGGGGGRDNDNRGSNVLAIVGIIFIILSPIIATLIQLAISRRREYLADASGALLTRYPEGLASALEKISSYGAPMKTASNATAHMYISNPFGAKAASGLKHLFMTHPPAAKRIQILRDMSV
ncbi:MAG: M48 family metalloprotease [Candidatus Pacebacteria bacterium]|jgi:heat shock protein HtpX|nr:M48 family metalloprotease [Candidatus Paceibacterota bacterium]MBP9701062.1 M48 family metalloprotease [Candidatus Paceibacterota bacterium]